ncbi:AMP-binding protein [Azospirillum thermophilum]|uniref:2-aminobenzoate-CoA ligase n=1 Tax=Azospirillum thermophilum TaxID=2202148 RepID=A0A2S2D066_9PROT|nr:AMP-binding protein [Azospirillum thermophilum]AWK89857.1 2-aminobenzoate-CoA ligase [Azospirillum thermophilum]
MFASAHVDSFARDRLPPPDLWPELLLDNPDVTYPERLNCVVRLLDERIAQGWGGRPCLFSLTEAWTYGELAERVNRIASVLVGRLGMVPGNRVLLRGANTPMMVAAYLAVMKAGGIAVATMPLLRAGELVLPIEKAEVALALCDHRLMEELETARHSAPRLARIVSFGSADAELERMMADAPPDFAACDTAQDDVCLLGFTSGTTGGPKATMHFHRDVMAIADTYGRHVLRATAEDRFIGSPPLAFTFGLGGLVIFPLAVGASTVLLERVGPDDLLEAIARFRATVLFTAPTAYRALLARRAPDALRSLRRCVSAGEHLPLATFTAWTEVTGIPLMDGIGATEMLHIFIGSPPDRIRPGSTGQPVPGFQAKIVDDEGRDCPPGTPGNLVVRGPTGCRYLDDPRQTRYVRDGWNWTGDTYVADADGYFWYQARSDDMIVSAGYNIAGPEVERALMTHPAVAECAVIGTPDPDRGMVVTAFVVAAPGITTGDALVRSLQDHVKAQIAPYKYPRRIEFLDELPKTPSGKLQRVALRRRYGTAPG